MCENSLTKFHDAMLAKYVECWHYTDARAEHDVSEEEAAYRILEHAGNLWRYEGTDRILDALRELEQDERRRLVLAACRYTDSINLAEQASHMYRHEALEAEQMEFIETVLVRRDALEVVLSTMAAACSGRVSSDAELRRALAQARCVAAQIDDVLLDRPDIIAIASSAMDGLYGQIRCPVDRRAYWWFNAVQMLGCDIEREWEELTRRGALGESSTRIVFTPTRPERRTIARLLGNCLRPPAVAAATGLSELARRELDAIQAIEYHVPSDAAVRFHLGVNIDERGRPRSLGLWLTPSGQGSRWEAIVARYHQARLHIPDFPHPFEVEIYRANGIFPLSDILAASIEEWTNNLEIELVDDQGNYHQVRLD